MKIFAFNLLPDDLNIDFLKMRKIFYIAFLALILGSLVSFFIKGFNLGIEFIGGGSLSFSLPQKTEIHKIRNILSVSELKDIVIVELGYKQTDFSLKIGSSNLSMLNSKISHIKDILNLHFQNIDYKEINLVGPQIGYHMIKSALLAIVISLIVIFCYIWVRFNFFFSLGISFSVLNNIIISLGFLSLLHLEINLNIVAAILTIVGYAINDSVVVYDRVRYNLQNKTIFDHATNITISINQSFSRTVITSLTTLAANLVLIFYGGEAIKNFAILVFLGVFFGTIFSIFIAAPIIYDLTKRNLVK